MVGVNPLIYRPSDRLFFACDLRNGLPKSRDQRRNKSDHMDLQKSESTDSMDWAIFGPVYIKRKFAQRLHERIICNIEQILGRRFCVRISVCSQLNVVMHAH